MSRARTLALIALAAAVGSLLRLQFLFVPLTTDEGGYAAVARLWRVGYRLYGDVAWVDRPQGLLLLYRLAGIGDDAAAFRVLATGAAALVTVAVAAAAWALGGRRVALIAAVLYAVLAPAPHLEGFTANGELLSAPFAAGAVACAAWWLRTRRDGLLAIAGVCAACAPLVKQSAIDGAVVLAVVVLVHSDRRVRHLAVAAGGGVAPAAAVLAHAATVGIGDWWYAVLGYRTSTESAVSGDLGARGRLLVDSIAPALRDLAPLWLALIPGFAAARRAGAALIPAVWLAAGIVGFIGGGLYHPHYWVQLIAPLALVAAVGFDRLLARPRLAAATLAVGVATVLSFSVEVYAERSPARISALTSHDSRILDAPRVGRALRHSTAPGDRVYVIWANAAVYWYAQRPPAFRYLWYLNVARIPGARAAVHAVLTGANPPAAVAVYQGPDELDPSGDVSRTLRARYELVERIGDVPVYRLLRR